MRRSKRARTNSARPRSPDASVLFPGCSEDEIAIGQQAIQRIIEVAEGRVDAESARSVLGAAALLLTELCVGREADQ